MKKIIILIIISLAMCSFSFAQVQISLDKVTEIKLLESTRDDVRRILASYKLEAEEKYHYDDFSTAEAEIRVDYSEGKCDEFMSEGFKVPEWKAIEIVIEPNIPIKVKDLKINFSKYKKEKMYVDSDDVYVYHDKNAGIIFTVRKDEIEEIKFIPPRKYYHLMCDKEKAKILASTKSIFDNKLKDRRSIIAEYIPNFEKLHLSQSKIVANCNLSGLGKGKSCSESVKVIDVFAVASHPDNDVLTYTYTVSGGRMIGSGAKVQWDLTGVKAGTYTITAAVDNGAGHPQTKTESVLVEECSGCD